VNDHFDSFMSCQDSVYLKNGRLLVCLFDYNVLIMFKFLKASEDEPYDLRQI